MLDLADEDSLLPLPTPSVFFELSALEYERLFLRTRCLLREIILGYEKLFYAKSISKQDAISFAIDPSGVKSPFGEHSLPEPGWGRAWQCIEAGGERLLIGKFASDDDFFLINDRPTVAVLSHGFSSQSKPRIVLADNTKLSGRDILQLFKIKRSVWQYWTTAGYEDGGLPKPLPYQKDGPSKGFVFYKDFKPYAAAYELRKAQKLLRRSLRNDL